MCDIMSFGNKTVCNEGTICCNTGGDSDGEKTGALVFATIDCATEDDDSIRMRLGSTFEGSAVRVVPLDIS